MLPRCCHSISARASAQPEEKSDKTVCVVFRIRRSINKKEMLLSTGTKRSSRIATSTFLFCNFRSDRVRRIQILTQLQLPPTFARGGTLSMGVVSDELLLIVASREIRLSRHARYEISPYRVTFVLYLN